MIILKIGKIGFMLAVAVVVTVCCGVEGLNDNSEEV
jgi:hypothetical protein